MVSKTCNNCGEVLIVGENWYNYCEAQYDYRCKRCLSKKCAEYRSSNGGKRMAENKTCTSFLGVHVAERVLSKVFKNVRRMPNCNPGYDFICNKGKKIDVKSACLTKDSGHRNDYWAFQMKRNKVADYFLCLAFDNRENLNPLHMWLLPSTMFNCLFSTSISTSTITKWDEYRIDVTKVTECCNKIRGGNESGLAHTEDFGGC